MLLEQKASQVVNVDKLSYAGDLSRLTGLTLEQQKRHTFFHLDILDSERILSILQQEQPEVIFHLAAETHVDRSIDNPAEVVKTNVMGTLSLLEAVRVYWQELNAERQAQFRFIHVSTDEVYGDLSVRASASTEGDAYAPSSPYSASKAGADHLVHAWYKTYGLPVVLTHSCNNYGPYQHPEKLIPHMILNALAGQALPVYGDGLQQREWIHVDDHAQALWQVWQKGQVGSTYHIGTEQSISNLELVNLLCMALDEQFPAPEKTRPYSSLITHVGDRPGHDRRYALSSAKIKRDLGWQAQIPLKSGVLHTVSWYVQCKQWWQHMLDTGYNLRRQGL